mmetsp:Transcript_34987/g.82968  ORF Transcript_34987/g.82968 Transcript_34987/m.82968 type:complete len:364 (+) Transcript_34987:622-1713(+)
MAAPGVLVLLLPLRGGLPIAGGLVATGLAEGQAVHLVKYEHAVGRVHTIAAVLVAKVHAGAKDVTADYRRSACGDEEAMIIGAELVEQSLRHGGLSAARKAAEEHAKAGPRGLGFADAFPDERFVGEERVLKGARAPELRHPRVKVAHGKEHLAREPGGVLGDDVVEPPGEPLDAHGGRGEPHLKGHVEAPQAIGLREPGLPHAPAHGRGDVGANDRQRVAGVGGREEAVVGEAHAIRVEPLHDRDHPLGGALPRVPGEVDLQGLAPRRLRLRLGVRLGVRLGAPELPRAEAVPCARDAAEKETGDIAVVKLGEDAVEHHAKVGVQADKGAPDVLPEDLHELGGYTVTHPCSRVLSCGATSRP